MSVSAALVKELRDRTGAGMMECKQALVVASGDIELAIENMRKSGQAKAAKKAGRIAAEGVIVIKQNADGRQAALAEINCETDFVARDANFTAFASAVADLALNKQIADVGVLTSTVLQEQQTVEAIRQNLVAKIGENIGVRRVALFHANNGLIGSYSHGGRIGVVVQLKGGDAELAKDIAMHIAANNPLVVKPSDVPTDLLEKEREIASAQAQTSGKPAEVIAKMIQGRLSKYTNEVSLLGQYFVKDPNITVANLLQGKQAEVVSFLRYEVGEGIDKQETDFAAEVMAQVNRG